MPGFLNIDRDATVQIKIAAHEDSINLIDFFSFIPGEFIDFTNIEDLSYCNNASYCICISNNVATPILF